MEHGLRESDRRKPKVSRLPKLSLGLSSVKFIVNKFQEDTNADSNGAELVKYDPDIDIDEAYYNFTFDASKGQVLKRFLTNLAITISRCIPSVSYGNFGVIVVLISALGPKMLSYLVLYPLCRLVFGTLYPAYASYKAVRTKNLKEYVKWMMYWIVFALFSCTETFTDMFLSWFPFYYEVKIVLVLWLLSPATKGSSILYRKFVHPALCRREQEIDEYIAKAKDQGYHTVLNLGTKGVNYATTVIMQTAIKGGGGLVQQIKKSYSLSDLSECDPQDERSQDEADDVLAEPRLIRRNTVRSGYNTRRSASESNNRSPMYFPEVDVDVRSTRATRSDQPDLSHIKSSEDISSGYSSADNSVTQLSRTSSVGAANRNRTRPRSSITPIKRPQAAEDDDVIIEELHEDDLVEYSNMPPLLNVSTPLFLSNSNPPFLYQCIGDQIKVVKILGNLQIDTELNNSESKLNIKNNDHVPEKIKDNENVLNAPSNDEPLNDTKLLNTSNNIPIETTNKDLIIEDNIIKEIEIENNHILPVCENNDQVVNESSTSNFIKSENNDHNEVSKIMEPTKTLENSDVTDCISMDTVSLTENYSAESDDEASFGTPDDSPKTKRKKSPRIGKHNKGRAPPPPAKVISEVAETINAKDNFKEILDISRDLTWNSPNTSSHIVNPIAENKKRHKTRSPARIKRNSTTISKLLQIPGKMAFWNKSDDKPKSDVSNSSDDHSRRSSTVEQAVDEFQSCTELNLLVQPNIITTEKTNEAEILYVSESLIEAKDLESELISRIQDKSEELQKLIEAKLESHPEYKIVSLHEEIPSSSKSTDV